MVLRFSNKEGARIGVETRTKKREERYRVGIRRAKNGGPPRSSLRRKVLTLAASEAVSTEPLQVKEGKREAGKTRKKLGLM